MKDILIMCSDNLTGIKEAINAAYPNTIQQRCIVHMIRNTVKFINYKDLKEFTSDLKLIYTSATEEQAYEKLQEVKSNLYSQLICLYSNVYIYLLKTYQKNGIKLIEIWD